jgi:hypothetical protein
MKGASIEGGVKGRRLASEYSVGSAAESLPVRASIPALEERDVRSPDAFRARHFPECPLRHRVEDVPAQCPAPPVRRAEHGHELLREPIGGKDVIGAALADDGRIVDGADVAFERESLGATIVDGWLQRRRSARERGRRRQAEAHKTRPHRFRPQDVAMCATL